MEVDYGVSGGSEASPASPDPSQSELTGAAPVAPPDGSVESNTPDREPFIPRSRFDEVNERMRAAEEWRQRYGWAEQVDPQQLQAVSQWYQRANTDPVGFAAQLLDELSAHATYGDTIRSHAARILGAQRGASGPPQPDLVGENGLRVYSAERAQELAQYYANQAVGGLKQELEPLKQSAAEQRYQGVVSKAERMAASQLQEAQHWHGFKEHENEVAQVFAANPSWSLERAYLQVLHDRILPSSQQQAAQGVLTDLKQRAAATTVKPTSATASPRFKTFKDALEHFSRQAER